MKTIKFQSALIVILLMLVASNTLSQPATNSLIKVIVGADRNDWTYKVNEKATFSVQVLKYGSPINNVTIGYEAGPEMFPNIIKEGIVLKNGRTELSGTMKVPGFYRVRVWAVVDGRRYQGMATAAFEPEKIGPTVKDPADFESFWNNAIAEARKLDLDPRMTLLPERCTGEVNVYHISFRNDAFSSRIYGILSVPKKPGKYPAILRVPPAGVYAFEGDARTASLGFITLEIGIHGIPVNLDLSL